MQRKFLINLSLLLLLNLLVKPFYILGIDAEVQERVGPEIYGTYFALFGLSVLLNILLDLGINNFNTRNIAQHSQLLAKHMSGIITVRMLLVGLYMLIAMLAGLVLGYGEGELYLLAWLMCNQVLIAFILYMRSNLAGLHLFWQDSVLSVLDRLLLIGMCAWLLWSGVVARDAFQIEWFVHAQTIAYAITAVVVTLMVLRRGSWLGLRFRKAFAWMIIKRSAPYALLILLMSFYYRSDSVMLERLLPDGKLQAGIYAQGFRFLDALNMIGFLFAGLLLPIFSRMHKQREPLGDLVWLAFRLMIGGAITVAIISSWHGVEVMDLRYSEHTEASGPAYSILMWSFVAMAVTYIFGTLLTAKGDLRFLNWTAGVGMVLNLGLNFLVIPEYKALGAAMTSLVTQSLVAVVQMIYVLRSGDVQLPHRLILRMALFVGGAFLIVSALDLVLDAGGIRLFVMLLCVGAWAMLSGMIDLRGMLRILIAREATRKVRPKRL